MGLFARIKDPVEGTARVVGCSGLPGDNASIAPCLMQLVVEAPGIDAFPSEQSFQTHVSKWPSPGQMLPVTFDRENHDRMKVNWDRITSGRDQALQQAASLAASAAGGGPAAVASPGVHIVDGSSPEGQQLLNMIQQVVGTEVASGAAVDPSGDTASQLERLAKLHQQGVLSDAEFQLAKQHVIGT